MDHPDAPATSAPPPTGPSHQRVWTARGLAMAADALQIVLFPLFGEGFASPADVVLDAAVALALTKLVGFHWSYLPSAALEVVPGADLAPTWTAAAFLATAGTSTVIKRVVYIAGGALIFLAVLAVLLIRQWPGR